MKTTRHAAAPSTGRSAAVCCIVIVAAGALAFANSFGGVFLLDDYGHIVTSETIRSIGPISKHLSDFRPLVHFSLAVNYAISELDVWSDHALNLSVHLAAALALFGVVHRTIQLESVRTTVGLPPQLVALAIALPWVVHPIQTQAVTYIIQRGEAMMGLFYLLTLYCVIRASSSSWQAVWCAASILACAAGMLCKEAMVTAPIIVYLHDAVFLTKSWSGPLRRRWLLYALLASTWGILLGLGLFSDLLRGSTAHAPDIGFRVEGLSPMTYMLTQPEVILHYLRLCFWPQSLCLDYGWEFVSNWRQAALPGLAIIAMLVATIWALLRRPMLGFLGAWIFVILAPTSSIVPIKVFAFEHRMYLPLAAIIAIVVIGAIAVMKRWPSRSFRKTVVAAGSLVVVALGARTLARNADYRSASGMWADVVAQRPRNVRAWNSYGVALSVDGRIEEAAKAHERALQIESSSEEGHINLGKGLAKLGRYDEAVQHYRIGLKTLPDDVMLHHSLAIALEKSGRLDEALAEYRESLRLDPSHPFARYNMGLALKSASRWAEAEAAFAEAVRFAPSDLDARFQRSLCLAQLGRRDEAIAELRAIRTARPDHAAAAKLLEALTGNR